jgi:phasin
MCPQLAVVAGVRRRGRSAGSPGKPDYTRRRGYGRRNEGRRWGSCDPRGDLIKNSYSTAVKGLQDYNNKIIEFAHANTNAAFDFVQKLSGVKSPSTFLELSTKHARKQLETLTEQTKQLAALAQKATLATAEPLKTGVAEAFNHAA